MSEENEFSVETYKAALLELLNTGKLTAPRLKMLQVQYATEDHDLTAAQLSLLMGWQGHGLANLNYGKLGGLFAPFFSSVPAHYHDGRPMYFSLLSSWWHDGNYYHWTMRPALAQALEELGLVGQAEQTLDVLEPEFGELPPRPNSLHPYPEGATRQVLVNAYERNHTAREACIAYHGPICAVCDSDLEEFYGPIAYGFTHVHHLKPLSEVGERYSVDPEKDLVPACPNCHAMLHRRQPPLTVEELRERIQEAHR